MPPSDQYIYRSRYYRRPDVRKFLRWVLDGHESIRPRGEKGLYALDLDGVPEGIDLAGMLEELSNLGLFNREIIDARPLCPKCDSPEFYDRYLCPSCQSARLERRILIEHYDCGFIGLEEEFMKGDRPICPKCGGDLEPTGADHGRIEGAFRCLDCKGGFSAPTIRHICAICDSQFTYEDAHLRHIYEYRFNEGLRGEVISAYSAIPLAEYLRAEGYQVEDLVALRGASGIEHSFDIVATKGKDSLAISIASSPSEVGDDEVVRFFAKVFDARPTRAILVAMPKLSEGALKLAKFYGIETVEGRDAGEVRSSMERLFGE